MTLDIIPKHTKLIQDPSGG